MRSICKIALIGALSFGSAIGGMSVAALADDLSVQSEGTSSGEPIQAEVPPFDAETTYRCLLVIGFIREKELVESGLARNAGDEAGMKAHFEKFIEASEAAANWSYEADRIGAAAFEKFDKMSDADVFKGLDTPEEIQVAFDECERILREAYGGDHPVKKKRDAERASQQPEQ